MKPLLKWQNGTAKHSYPHPESPEKSRKYTGKLHSDTADLFAKSMSWEQIEGTTNFIEDSEKKRKERWKELNIFLVVSLQPAYKNHSLEKALWQNHDKKIDLHRFISAMTAEFRFDPKMKFDKRLHMLFLTFDGSLQEQVDWRDILASYMILQNYAMIRNNTVELILLLFDLFTIGRDSSGMTQHLSQDQYRSSINKERYKLEDAHLYITRIFLLPCIMETEIAYVKTLLQETLDTLKGQGRTISRRAFQLMLRALENSVLPGGSNSGSSSSSSSSSSHNNNTRDNVVDNDELSFNTALTKGSSAVSAGRSAMVMAERSKGPSVRVKAANAPDDEAQHVLLHTWSRMCWSRLSVDLRLKALDEQQNRHKESADNLLYRYKLVQAMKMYMISCCRLVFKEWRIVMMKEAGVRHHHHMKLLRWRQRYFQFWLYIMRTKKAKRQKRVLAEVVGSFAVKARCFARLRLFQWAEVRLRKIGLVDRKSKEYKLGGTHLRNFRRLNRMKTFFHRWWNEISDMINFEIAIYYDRVYRLRVAIGPWKRYALEKAHLARLETITLENKNKFDRMMEETQKAAEELVRLEQERQKRIEEEQKRLAQLEKERKLEESKRKLAQEREKERLLLLGVQQEERRRRCQKDMKRMKQRFKTHWDSQTKIELGKAHERIKNYINNKDNKLAVEMKFEATKREFLLAPVPENKVKEEIRSNRANIVFLYVQAKLRKDMLTLEDLIKKYDTEKKGYLIYDQFHALVRSLGTSLTKAEVHDCITAIDLDGDGFLEYDELNQALTNTEEMGVPGSAWKMYVHPVENVMCYHNFDTGELHFDYLMKDKKLKEITLANMYGESEAAAVVQIREKKKADWDLTVNNYMAERIQYMYRRRRAKKWREKKLYKIEKRFKRIIIDTKKFCVRVIEKTFVGRVTRDIFQKQLFMNYEKIWDTQTGRLFWYNHHTKQSSWDRPKLLMRYPDVPPPGPWIPIDISSADNQGSEVGDSAAMQAVVLAPSRRERPQHYWHVPSKRDLPRKPDGLRLCCSPLQPEEYGDGINSDDWCRNIAMFRCLDCEENFCAGCRRVTHSHPLGFPQRSKASKEQYMDNNFVRNWKYFEHEWVNARPIQCTLCKSHSRHAGLHCAECDTNMCKPCSRRVHEHESKKDHQLMEI